MLAIEGENSHDKNLSASLYAPCSLRLACPPRRSSQRKSPGSAYLGATSLTVNAARVEAFRQGLRELGYVEGKNIVIEWRSAEGKLDRLPALAAELVQSQGRRHRHRPVRRQPVPAKEATRRFPLSWDSIPIRLASEFVASLARPGGNITGIVHACPGDKRKTTGAYEGNRSQAFARGRPREFNESGRRACVKRDRTRRTCVQGEASITRRTRAQGC